MDMLWRRRTALFCLVFVYAGFASALLPTAASRWGAVVSAVLLALSVLPPLKGLADRIPIPHTAAVLRIFLCALMLGLAFFGGYRTFTADRYTARYDGQTAAVTAVIRDRQYAAAYMAAYTADIETAAGDTFRVLLETDETTLTCGDRITADVTFSAFAEYSGAFPEKRYYASLGTCMRAEAENLCYTGTVPTGIRGLFSAWQDSLSGMLRADLGRKNSALPAALLLGDRSDLPDTLTRDLKRLGVSHLLAISGLHFTLLLSWVERILTPLIPGKKKRAVLLMAADIGYMLLCGMTAPVVRAGLMMLIAYFGMFLGRQSDTPTSLGAASFFLCIAEPAAVFSVGLQLSVTAVLALCVFSHMQNVFRTDAFLSRGRRIARQVLEALLLPVVVQLALMPLLCLYFGEISLLTPIATVLFSPAIQLILFLSPLYLLLRVIPPAAVCIGAVIGWTGEGTAVMAEALSSLPFSVMSLTAPFAPYFSVALAAAVLTVPLCRTRRALRMHLRGGICILILFAVLSAVRTVTTADEVRILSVSRGKNDAVIVLTAGDAMLMDISDGSYASLSYAYSEAAKCGATELEALYLTHLHTRHIQSTARLCDTVYVRSLFLPAPDTAEEETVFTALSAIAEKNGIPLYVYAASDTVSWGDSVTVRPTGRVRLSRSTHPVIALSVEAGGSVFSYLGASASEISALTDQTKADVLVLGAHGPIYKKEITLSLSAGLRAAVLRGDAESFCGTSLQQALDSVDVHTGTAAVRFVLKP